MPPKPKSTKNKVPLGRELSSSEDCVEINSEEFYVVETILSKVRFSIFRKSRVAKSITWSSGRAGTIRKI